MVLGAALIQSADLQTPSLGVATFANTTNDTPRLSSVDMKAVLKLLEVDSPIKRIDKGTNQDTILKSIASGRAVLGSSVELTIW